MPKRMKGQNKGHFKKGNDERRAKGNERWTDSQVSRSITRMTSEDYHCIMSTEKSSGMLLSGATDKKVPPSMILRPAADKRSLIDTASDVSSNTQNTYRILHLEKTAALFHHSYAGHNLWSSTCKGRLEFDLESEMQWGFAWRERLVCQTCGFISDKSNLYEEINTDKPGAKAANINLSVASGLMDTKIGPSDLRYIVMCLQIPPPSFKSMQNHCNFAADRVEQVAEASFTRARQQVQRTNIACGFDAQEPILAGIDSQYNNRLQSASDTTPMQPATQVSTSIIEMQTKQKKIIGMHVSNKLCSRGDHTTCDDKGGCTKNLLETDVIGDEYREAKACMSSILSSEVPVNIGEMTTDGDSNAYKGARDAQIQITGKPMARMADVIHLTKSMRNKIKKMNFSRQMFNAPNQKEYKFLRGRFAKEIAHRVFVEFKIAATSRATTEKQPPRLFDSIKNIKSAIIKCYSGKCGQYCRKFSLACNGKPPNDCWKKDFWPSTKGSCIIKGQDRQLLLQCLNMRLGKIAVRKTRACATTNKLEALHRAINASNPKDVTFRRNAKARKLSAAARLNDGRANSALEKALSVGAPINPEIKIIKPLQQLQQKALYDQQRQLRKTTRGPDTSEKLKNTETMMLSENGE